ncbi:MAG: hypothetical protein IBJ10_00080 [Phycisphaerales bacterium]|nr:hypothetical protein [Phycisphaerales bacterium]
MSPTSPLAVIALAAAVAAQTSAGLPEPQDCAPQQLAMSGGRTGDVAVRGRHAYVAGQYGGLGIYDVSNPLTPIQVRRDDSVVPVFVEIDGNIGVVYEQIGSRVRFFKLDDPLAPTFHATLPFSSSLFSAFDVEGDVFVMGEGIRLRTYDISDVDAPVLLVDTGGLLNANESVRALRMDGGRLAVSLRSPTNFPGYIHGLLFVDITNPASPVRGGLLTMPGFSGTLAYSNGVCVLTRPAKSGHELVVLDASDIHSPVVLGTAPAPEASSIEIVGDVVHLTSRDLGTSYATFSIADPTQPIQLGHFNIAPGATLSGSNGANAVAVSGDVAFVVFQRPTLGALDIADPASPQLLAQAFGADGARSIAHRDGLAFVADWGELRAIDLTDPARPVGVFRDPLSVGARHISIDREIMAVACDARGTLVYDISNPRSPQRLATIIPLLSPQAESVAVAVEGDRLYVVEDRSTRIVRVVDISQPSAPLQLGFVSEVDIEMIRFAFSGDYAYLTGSEGVNIWDMSVPNEPELVNTLPGALIVDIDIDGTVLAVTRFVGSGSPRPAIVELFDLANPSAPDLLSTLNHSNPWGPQTSVTGDRLIMLSSNEAVFDISDPRHPTLITANTRPMTPGTLYPRMGAFSDGGLLLLGSQDFLYIFDLSPCILACAADADGSGLVDMADLNLVLSAFNAFPGDDEWIAAADLDGDGHVSFGDLNLLVGGFHTDCDPAP